MPVKRIFTGIRVQVENTLLTCIEALRKGLDEEKIKWVETDKMHLTLWFFGDTQVSALPSIGEQLHLACREIPPFHFELEGCGYFGKKRQPSVLWVGMKVPFAMSELHQNIKIRLAEIGIRGEERDFRPHLTLARIKEIRDTDRFHSLISTFSDQHFQSCEAREIVLFESILRPQGPLYLPLQTFQLQAT